MAIESMHSVVQSTQARKNVQNVSDRWDPSQHSAYLWLEFLEEGNRKKDFKKYGLKWTDSVNL